MGANLYILKCADGSYCVGATVQSLEERVSEHRNGASGGYTSTRRPVELVYENYFPRLDDAAAVERQVKGWRREKKEALIRRDYGALPGLARRWKTEDRRGAGNASFETRPDGRSSG